MATPAVVPKSPSSMASPSSPDRRSKEIPPPLSLTVDAPRHSSPFPSPSSSFVPPPMPGAHEFANKPLTGRFVRRKKSGSPSKGLDDPSSPATYKKNDVPNKDTLPEPNGAAPTLDTDVLIVPPTTSVTPLTPTPGSLAITPTSKSPPVGIPAAPNSIIDTNPAPESPYGRNTPTQMHIALPSPPESPSQVFSGTATPLRTPSGSGTASKHTSLSSSRPAPASPSPAPSRRQSGAPSRRSRLSIASTSSSKFGTIKSPPVAQPVTARRRGEIKIRDYAFLGTDVRHKGRGPDAPKVIKRLLKRHGSDAGSRRASGMSESSVESEDGSSRRSSGFGGWGAFRWASKLGGPWGFGNAGASAGASGSGSGSRTSGSAGYVPSQQDFERNFDDTADGDPSDSADDDGEGEYFSDYDNEGEGEGEGEGESEELLPGLYRALYDFDPEGTAEMGLKEGQVVKVVGRGGGVGWAIAVRPGAAAEEGGESNWALVPESYLRVVRLDEDGDDASLDDAEPERAGDTGD